MSDEYVRVTVTPWAVLAPGLKPEIFFRTDEHPNGIFQVPYESPDYAAGLEFLGLSK